MVRLTESVNVSGGWSWKWLDSTPEVSERAYGEGISYGSRLAEQTRAVAGGKGFSWLLDSRVMRPPTMSLELERVSRDEIEEVAVEEIEAIGENSQPGRKFIRFHRKGWTIA